MTKLARLTLLALLATAAPTIHAQTVSPVPAPTIITTQPYTISKPGYYQLGADLVSNASSGNIITIASGNVTLDFAGHYISGPSTANTSSQIIGVYSYEHGNLNIRNGTVAYCYQGIDLDGNETSTSLNINQRVDNMLVSYCYFIGVDFRYATNSVVSNCRVSYTGNNTSAGNAFGIDIEGSANQVLDNAVTNTAGSSGEITYGILCSTDTAVIGNLVSTVTTTNGGDAYGIYLCGFADRNKVYNAKYGIYNAAKYIDNLTLGCATPFTGGTAVGSNN